MRPSCQRQAAEPDNLAYLPCMGEMTCLYPGGTWKLAPSTGAVEKLNNCVWLSIRTPAAAPLLSFPVAVPDSDGVGDFCRVSALPRAFPKPPNLLGLSFVL